MGQFWRAETLMLMGGALAWVALMQQGTKISGWDNSSSVRFGLEQLASFDRRLLGK